MKDAKGHGSNPRGGIAHQSGVARVGKIPPAQKFVEAVNAQRFSPASVAVVAEGEPWEATLQRLNVPENERGFGYATDAMNKVTSLADKHGVNLSLEAHPDEDEPGMNTARLVDFYKRFGFEGNGMMSREAKHRG
jgi:GNAT superfamily N-acetyltransferase